MLPQSQGFALDLEVPAIADGLLPQNLVARDLSGLRLAAHIGYSYAHVVQLCQQ